LVADNSLLGRSDRPIVIGDGHYTSIYNALDGQQYVRVG
jgi:hypothetical protein